jgi:hypothetical protein
LSAAFWGAAIVIFLVKIINLHNEDRQGFWVEISSQIENGKSAHGFILPASSDYPDKFAEIALFTVTGIGLIPWRVIDTYRTSGCAPSA